LPIVKPFASLIWLSYWFPPRTINPIAKYRVKVAAVIYRTATLGVMAISYVRERRLIKRGPEYDQIRSDV
jgi:hypothetical protein